MYPKSSNKIARYRNQLPQLSGDFFLTDGGIETTLIFNEGFELPKFAAFDLLKHAEGRAALHNYFSTYAAIAQKFDVGIILESPTWRSSPDWGQQLGYSSQALVGVNTQAIELLSLIRNNYEGGNTKIVISGCIGPRGDGYNPGSMMSAKEAEQYHSFQINTFADSEADLVTALTVTYPEEAIGIVRAAQKAGMPVVISFTVETDGRLPCGLTLREAIEKVDSTTGFGPAYYMINCAHPTHFENTLVVHEEWIGRLRGIRANASRLSHAELDEAEELDDGNPVELGIQYSELRKSLTQLNVLGGCCGTDHRHIEQICRVFAPQIA